MHSMNERSLENPGIGRKRDRLLVDALLKAAARHGGQLTEGACFEAVNEVHQRPVKASTAVAIVRKKLANPNIRRALQDAYQYQADLTVLEAIDMHAKHVRGEITKQAVTKDGVIDLKVAPSWPALKTFLDMTLPQPAKKVSVEVSGPLGRSMLDDVPPIKARQIGSAVVENIAAETIAFRRVDEGAE
jgi:hypothetical protein